MISIAIPFYKGLDYLRLAITSVRAQTSPTWQLTVSDDGGVDPGARELVNSFGDARIHYSLSEKRLGMVGNWNRCLSLATTDHVTLLHGDDELLPDYVEKMQSAWKKHPDAAAVFCQPKVIGHGGGAKFSFPDFYKRFLIPTTKSELVLQGEPALVGLLKGNYIFCPTLCYRKSALGHFFLPQWKMVQDLDLTTGLLMEGKKIVGIPDVAYAYRRHADNATNDYNRSLVRFEEELRLLKKIQADCDAKNWREAATVAKRANIVRLHLLYKIAEDTATLRWSEAKTKLGFLRRNF